MNFLQKVMSITLGVFLIAGVSFAQVQQQQGQQGAQLKSEDVSDKELKNFVATAGEVQNIQRESQAKLQEMVKAEGLEFQRFQMIMMSKQNPKMADSVEISDKEQAAFKKIQPKMSKMNQKMLQRFQSTIKENDLTQQRFQMIAQAMQSSPKLQKRFQKMQAKQMQEDGNNS